MRLLRQVTPLALTIHPPKTFNRQLITPALGRVRNERQTQPRSLCSALCHLATLSGTARNKRTLENSAHTHYNRGGISVENAERTVALGAPTRRRGHTSLTGSTLARHEHTARYGHTTIPKA